MKPLEIIHNPNVSPVYDLTVDRFHNYATESGLILHNCELREIYHPRDQYSIQAHFDYSQMEVRVLAGVAGETTLIEAFRQGKDVHRYVASKVWRISESEVTDAQRRYAKMSCLVGSTKIKLLDGRYVKIEDLYNSRETPEVYSFDIKTNKIVAGQSVDIQLTKYVKQIAKVTFENQKSIECTLDHPILTTTGMYVEAQHLLPGAEIETLFYKTPRSGAYSEKYEMIRNVRHERLSGSRNPDIKLLVRCGRWEPTHHMVRGYPEYGDNIDHVDGNRYNNTRVNLQELSKVNNLSKGVSDRSNRKDGFAHLGRAQRVLLHLHDNNLELTESNYERFRCEIGGSRTIYFETLIKDHDPQVLLNEGIEARIELNRKMRDPMTDGPSTVNNFDQLGWKVQSVEFIDLETEIPVYDLSVDQYQNYAIDLGDNSAVFVHNTFSILYGKTIEGFASEFMGGDVAGARKLFRDFYAEFPAIEAWIKKRHEQVASQGFVTTMFGNPIHIDTSNLNQAFRHAQNYPIQSSASSLAAFAIWDLYIKCQARNIGAIPVGFTHDASDQDVLVKDLFPFIDTMYECAVDSVGKRFGIPAAIDWELGVDQNRTIELSETARHSLTSREFTFSGTQHSFDAVMERLKTKYTVDYEITKTKSKYNTMMELFITRRAFSRYLGETIDSVSGNLKLELIEA